MNYFLESGYRAFIAVVRFILLLSIQAYRLIISPLLPQSCRFYPSCSNYAIEAIRQHGIIRGSILAAVRIVKCNPFHSGGYDPVPGSFILFK